MYSWVEGGTVQVNCLAQGHNTLTGQVLDPELSAQII